LKPDSEIKERRALAADSELRLRMEGKLREILRRRTRLMDMEEQTKRM